MEDRNRQISDLDTQFNIGQELVNRLEIYFANNESQMDLTAQEDVQSIMDCLPDNLKVELTMHVNASYIQGIEFLRNRPQKFYLDVLADNKLSPMRFDQDDIIFSVGQVAREVYLIVNGEILNETTKRLFKSGAMVGHEDIVHDRKRDCTVKANSEVWTLKMEKETLEKIFEDYPEIKYDMIKRATRRDHYFNF